MRKNHYEHFSEQEMFAPARIQILTETKQMKFDIRGTNPKSNSQRIVNLAFVLLIYSVLLIGAIELTFNHSSLVFIVASVIGFIPVALGVRRIRKLSNRDSL